MSDMKALTPVQRRILVILRERGTTCITGYTRDFLSGDCAFGPMIQAYCEPERALQRRGLIECVQSNAPGRWYRLTLDGERRAQRIEAERLFRPAVLQRWREARAAT